MPEFADFDYAPDPEQIAAIYEGGYCGTTAESSRSTAFFRGSQPTFYDAFPDAVGVYKEIEICLPIRGCQTLLGENFCADGGEAQRQGDCVGKMVRNQGMIDGCNDALFGETEWLKDENGRGVQYCCENFYGMRGHSGGGANCWRLWNTAGPEGSQGFLFRKRYETSSGTIDLSRYRSDLSGKWGRRGTPEGLSEIAAENPAMQVYRIKSIEEAMDALCLGFGLGRCGSQGYSKKRNEDGLSERTTSWNHAITCGGFDRTSEMIRKYRDPIWLFLHCWGKWNGGPKRYEQPDGSWWVRTKELEACIRSGSCAAIGGVKGHNRSSNFEYHMDRRSALIKKGDLKMVCS